MRRHTKNSGFTLVEMIAVLVIVGVLAAVAGMGIVKAAQAFAFNSEATALSQKAELAMDRLRRSLENLTDISSATSSSIGVSRLSGETIVTERYYVSGSDLMLTSSESGAGTNTLTDLVDSFSLSYKMADDSAWSFGSNLEDLARIEFTLTMEGPNGTSMSFANYVVPRNTYIPDIQRRYYPAGSTTGSAPGCFVATAAFGSDSDSRVFALTQFRDQYLTQYSLGRWFLNFYNENGPGMAQTLHSHYWLKSLVRLLLLPAAGFAFLAMYFPLGFVLIGAMAWLLSRLVIAARNERRKAGAAPAGASGAVLLSLVIAMVVMAAIGAGMVSMYSASNTSSAATPFTARAHYIAESGLRYAGWILEDNLNDDTFITTDLHKKSFAVDDDSFYLEILTYWYDTGTSTTPSSNLSASAWGGLPKKVLTIPDDAGGFLTVEKSDGSSELVRYNSITVNAASDDLGFSLTSTPSGTYKTRGRILPAAKIPSAGTIRAANLGDSSGDSLEIDLDSLAGENDTFLFPKMMGIITLTDASNKDWYIMYDSVDYDSDKLVGIRNCPGRTALPSGGITVNAGTPVQLERYAMFVSTGIAGEAGFQAQDTISRSQSMGTVSMYRGVEGGIDFNDPNDINKVDPVLGSAAIEDGAIKITGTEQTYSYTEPVVYQQESLIAVDWQDELIDTLNLEDIWNRSSRLLSYDLQVKVKFTENQDDLTAPYVNVPGSYMPGLSFRTYCSGGQCNYYGLSFMRGVQGRTEVSSGGDGCGGGDSTYEEDDDIADGFFSEHGSNTSISVCGDTYSSWNDYAPKDGVPYLMFWQKYLDPDDDSGSGCGGGEESLFDWISYVQLVDVEEVSVYYYEPVTCWGEWNWHGIILRFDEYDVNWAGGWYEGEIPGDSRNSRLYLCSDRWSRQWARQGPYTAWKLTDKYGLFRTSTVEGVTVLGIPGGAIVRNPATVSANSSTTGSPVPNVAYIVDPESVNDSYQQSKGTNNYRIYPKEWATLMVRIIEMQGDFDCDGADDNRVNAVAMYAASPDANGSNASSDDKDGNRVAYARNSPVKWPEDSEYFTLGVMGSRHYTSKEITAPRGCGDDYDIVRLAGRGQDSEGDYVVTYSGTFTTEDYDFTSNVEEVEFGLHTLGIDATADSNGNPTETCYFDDLYWSFWEGGATGVMPGVQQQ